MSHISGEAINALFSLTEIKAADECQIAVVIGGKAIKINKEDETPLTLGDLREIAAAFGCWL